MTAASTCVLAMAGALAACQRSDGRTTDDAAAGAELVLVGRFDDGDPAAPRFAWSGSTITTRFSGATIAVELEESEPGNHYQIVVDGAATTRLATSSGRRTYPLARDLGAGRHEVSLHRLTEPFLGETRLHAVALDGGARPVRTESSRARRLELIGDSISAGYGNEGADASCPFSAGTENHYLSWGAVAARALDAELTTIAWSGKGVFSNRGSTTDLETMPALWTRTLPARTRQPLGLRAPPARRRRHQPGHQRHRDDHARLVAVRRRLPRLRPRRARPLSRRADPVRAGADAERQLARGPKALTTARQGITGAVATLTAEGDAAIGFLELAPQDGSTGYGCDWHPSVAPPRPHGERARGGAAGPPRLVPPPVRLRPPGAASTRATRAGRRTSARRASRPRSSRSRSGCPARRWWRARARPPCGRAAP